MIDLEGSHISNLSWLNLHDNEHVGETHFKMTSFARRLVLTQRRNGSQMACCANILDNI